ncbi:MAG: LamG domain-containing protein, partial [Candidatus Hydrogenedentota bacterium]
MRNWNGGFGLGCIGAFMVAAVLLPGTASGELKNVQWGSTLYPGAWKRASENPIPFDGTKAYSIPAEQVPFSSKALTVAAWVKLDAVDDPQVFLNRGAANEDFTFYLYKDAVRMLVAHGQGAYAYALAPPPEPGMWTHYAGTYDGKTIKAYRNGELTEAKEVSGALKESNAPLVIGGLNWRERLLKGAMTNVRLYDEVLNAEQIVDLAAGKPVKAGGLVWTGEGYEGQKLVSTDGNVTATKAEKPEVLVNTREDGYRGIWYYNQKSG